MVGIGDGYRFNISVCKRRISVTKLVHTLQMGEICHDFLRACPLEGDGQKMIVAHGGDGQDAAGPKGLVKYPVVHLPAFAGSRRGKGCGNADPLGGAAPPASDLARRARGFGRGRREKAAAFRKGAARGISLPVFMDLRQLRRDILPKAGGPVAGGGAVKHPGWRHG